MFRNIIAACLLALGAAACTEVKEVPRDATVHDLSYYDMTGNFLTDVTLTETTSNGSETIEFPISFFVHHTGVAVDWFGVTGLALPDKILFAQHGVACFDTNCNVGTELHFVGDAVLTEGVITTTFITYNQQGSSTLERVWDFNNITRFEDVGNAILSENLVSSDLVKDLIRDSNWRIADIPEFN